MQNVDYLQSDDNEVVVTPYTVKYADSVFELIDSNRQYLDRLGITAGSSFMTIDNVIDDIANPVNPNKERYLLLFRGILAGYISLSPVPYEEGITQIDFWIEEQFECRGLACRSVEMLTAFVLERPTINEVIAFSHPHNFKSQRTLELAGFQFVSAADNNFRKYSTEQF